ncbi:MAG: DNA mismatch repair protein MutS, partial [Treponema sp.]|nr:DNA mismatch repair protein MutS [Treponema sp.]
KIKEGPTEESYGLHVASLAGLPERVLIRADEIMLSLLEQRQNQKTVIAKNKAKNASAKNQLTNKFDTMAGLIKNEISLLDVNKLTPLEALNMIGEWKKQLKNKPEPEWKRENKPLNDNPSLFDLNDK